MKKYTAEQRIAAFWQKVDKSPRPKGCWEWKGASQGTYGMMRVDGRPLRAHRISYELANGPIPGDLIVCHECDNRKCVNPAHLFLGTHKDNCDDKIAKGRANNVTGERHGSCKLTDAQVAEIRRLYANGGVTYPQLAKQFGVWKGHIRKLVKRVSRA